MTIWVTKYALTKGLHRYDNAEKIDDSMVKVPAKSNSYCDQYFHRMDWHITAEEARNRANEMVRKRVASLEKQLAKFKRMKF